MGLIKTAMMSGAAIYGINQISKAAQNRNSNPNPAPTRAARYSDDDQYYHNRRPLEFRERNNNTDQARYVDPPTYQDQDYNYDNRQRRQRRLYLDQQRQGDAEEYYIPGRAQQQQQQQQQQTNNHSRYEYVDAYQYAPMNSRQEQRGFIEPDEVYDDPREPRYGFSVNSNGGSGRVDMAHALAQQAMSMGLVGGGGGGKKDKDRDGKKGDLLAGLIGK